MWPKVKPSADRENDAAYDHFRQLGHEALNSKDIAGSIKHFQAAAALKPDSAEAWLSLGHALSAAGDAKRSTMAFFRCLSIETEAAAKARGLQDFIRPYSAGNYFPELDPYTFAPKYPGIFIASLPKSGTSFLQESLCEGLNKPPLGAPSGGLFPNATIAQSAIDTLNERGAVYVTHCAPSAYNITEVNHRLERLVVHTRDPRQALLSWVHFVPAVIRDADPVQRYHYSLPDDYESLTLEQQIDWQIEHRLPDIIAFMQGWWTASQQPHMKTKFLFTRQEDLSEDPRGFFCRLLHFYGIPEADFKFPDAPRQGERNFRAGRTDEWKRVFTSQQIERSTSMIPKDLGKQFGWPDLG
jgi:tetratricopeptide (TPR) repeat protein